MQSRRLKRVRTTRKRRVADERVMAVWSKVCPGLRKKYPEGVLAIHRPTGEWFAGRDLNGVILRGLRRYPEGGFELLRIGESPLFKMRWRPRRRVPPRS